MMLAAMCASDEAAGTQDDPARRTLDLRLAQLKLGEAERAVFVAERRALANAAAKGSGKRRTSRAFLEETARISGYSVQTHYRDLRRADGLGLEMLNKIKGTTLDSGSELDGLIALPAKRRHDLVERAVSGEKVSAKLSRKK